MEMRKVWQWLKFGTLGGLVILGGVICFLGLFDEEGLTEDEVHEMCLDDGGVWDSLERRCRRDCLTFNEDDGCVALERTTLEEKLAERIGELVGQEVLYSSPYQRGDEAVSLQVKTAEIGDDFVDRGEIILNGKAYPSDQLFIKNGAGRFENLLSLYRYDGVGGTFFLRYYDRERLAVDNEKATLLIKLERCVKEVDEGNVSDEYQEIMKQSACVDGVYERFLELFYNFSADELRGEYQAMVKALFKSFSGLIEADYCYGKCGSLAAVSALGRALELQALFVQEALKDLQIDEDGRVARGFDEIEKCENSAEYQRVLAVDWDKKEAAFVRNKFADEQRACLEGVFERFAGEVLAQNQAEAMEIWQGFAKQYERYYEFLDEVRHDGKTGRLGRFFLKMKVNASLAEFLREIMLEDFQVKDVAK
ncbi:MAG: hypothetical protein J6C85_02455 [Alphaproteobacteria bacterium]|nr:hypothetical protein [Alphaproteobacteria bacterium]